jgi:hypothetical protein
MEVVALRELKFLQAKPGQLEALRKLARETAPAPGARPPVKESEAFRKALTGLRDALVKGDVDRVNTLQKKVDDLREAEEIELTDQFELTDAARRRAGEALRLFNANQLAVYLAFYADDVADPLERVLGAMAEMRDLEGEEAEELRDAVAQQVGWLVAGLDLGRSGKVSAQVTALLDRARGLEDAAYAKQRPELEKAAGQIVGAVAPLEVLRHYLEWAMAELLSNPRLPGALDALLGKK